MHAHGAVFAEVKVDPDLGQIRATRVVGAFAAGRIVNPRMARSQLYGGMIWGVSFALHEHAVMDRAVRPSDEPQSGRVPHSRERRCALAGRDPGRGTRSPRNALGIKGVGEIGITGTAGAVANAVWHATGIRARKFPITLDHLIAPGS